MAAKNLRYFHFNKTVNTKLLFWYPFYLYPWQADTEPLSSSWCSYYSYWTSISLLNCRDTQKTEI
jgi:hypothetical protein